MHESSLMKGLMRQILVEAESHDAKRVASVGVVLGALSNITPAHFSEHFVEAARGTIVEGATLVIRSAEDITDPHAQDIMITSVEVTQ
jgi:hydrogenase nickel incorporation protein HypA/HybF